MDAVLHRGEVDGVPTFWVETGRPTLTAWLVFRAGMADETAATTGWVHLAEHLALHDREHGSLHVNGEVSLTTTTFLAHGSTEDVSAALAGVADWLREPVVPDLTREAGILAAEADLRGMGAGRTALVQRFGAHGPGLGGYREFGLLRMEEDRFRERVARFFARDNAVLVLDGPPPSGLRLPLLAGSALEWPSSEQSESSFPAVYSQASGLCLSGVLPRSEAATFVPELLSRELRAVLRDDRGGAYAPWSDYHAIGPDRALVLAGSDATETVLDDLVAHGTAALRRIVRGDIASSLEDVRALRLQSVQDPYATVGLAHRAASAHLRGDDAPTMEEVVDDIRHVRMEQVSRAASAMQDSLLVGVDHRSTEAHGLRRIEMPDAPVPSAGTRRRSAGWPADTSELVVGGGVLAMGNGTHWRSLRTDDAALLLCYPDGARELLDSSGWALTIEPTLWRDGRGAVTTLDREVAEDLHVRMPERAADQIPAPPSRRTRWWATVQRHSTWLWLLYLVVVAILVVVVHRSTGTFPVGGLVVGAGVFIASLLRERRQRRDAAASGGAPGSS